MNKKSEKRGFSFLDGAACASMTVEEADVQVRDGHAVHSDQPTLDHGRLERICKRNLMKSTDHNRENIGEVIKYVNTMFRQQQKGDWSN